MVLGDCQVMEVMEVREVREVMDSSVFSALWLLFVRLCLDEFLYGEV